MEKIGMEWENLSWPSKEDIHQPIDSKELQDGGINCEKTLGCICSLVSFDFKFHIESWKIPKEAWEIENLYGKTNKTRVYQIDNDLINFDTKGFDHIKTTSLYSSR